MSKHRAIRALTICLAIVAVGMSQVFGVAAGFLCGCTGQPSDRGICEPAECHPQAPALPTCQDNGSCGDDCSPDPPVPADDPHRHHEVRQVLLLTGFPPPPAVPPTVWFDLPPACQAPALSAIARPQPVASGPDPPRCRGMAMPQLVARTTVMLI